MRAVFCVPLFLAGGLLADEAGDRLAINQTMAALNDPGRRAQAFTKDVDSDVDFSRLIDLHRTRALAIGMDEQWRDLTEPKIVPGAVRFITPDVAIVDGASTVRGAVTLSLNIPLFFVLKRTGQEWKIAVVRRSIRRIKTE